MPIPMTVEIPVRVEQENLDRVVNVARTLRRVASGEEVAEKDATDALSDFLEITTVNGEKVSDHVSLGPERKITD
jgi:hypothetical protein